MTACNRPALLRRTSIAATVAVITAAAVVASMHAASAGERARDLGVPFHGMPGALNAITDVAGVEVGEVTLIDPPGHGGARTGVTAILPLGRASKEGVTAAEFTFNGTGEMTGSHLIHDFGAFFGPVLLTGTTAVGTVSEGALRWTRRSFDDPMQRYSRILPVVAETYDGDLNDAWSFPIRAEHVAAAIEAASSGPVAEGNAGGGTGMVAHEFKGGTGTSSRQVKIGAASFTVGVLVQANYGNRELLTIAGVPVGQNIRDLEPARAAKPAGDGRPASSAKPEGEDEPASARPHQKEGSIVIVIATDAPLSSTQLERMARRATVGLARVGGLGGATSGDLFLAFSTANRVSLGSTELQRYATVPGDAMSLLFQGVADATEEAIVNALVAAQTMTGYDGLTVHALPHDRLRAVLKRYGRLVP